MAWDAMDRRAMRDGSRGEKKGKGKARDGMDGWISYLTYLPTLPLPHLETCEVRFEIRYLDSYCTVLD